MKIKPRNLLFLSVVPAVVITSCSSKPNINLTELGNQVSLHSKAIDDFLVNPVDDNVQTDGKSELSKPQAIHLSWSTNFKSAEPFTIMVSENNDLSNPWTFATSETSFDLYNCKVNTTYYWQVKQGSKSSNISSFKTKDCKVRLINIDGVTNCRDLGGYKTTNNKEIKQGLIYRTSKLNVSNAESFTKVITQAGEDTMLNQLNIKNEIDLRSTETESAMFDHDCCVEGIKYSTCRMIGGNLLLNNATVIKNLFENVLTKEDSYPLCFHCSEGAGRTGCIAYTLLALCGVPKEDLIGDFLLSNYSLLNTVKKFAEIADNFPKTLDEGVGDTLMEKTANVLETQLNISSDAINKIRNIFWK